MAGEIFVSEGFSFKDWKGSNTSWRLPLLADDEAGSEQSSLQVSIMETGLLDMVHKDRDRGLKSTHGSRRRWISREKEDASQVMESGET